MAIDFADFEYVWPRDALVSELTKLTLADDLRERTTQLFAEAFGPRALRVLEALDSDDAIRGLILEVLDSFHALPVASGGGPYFAQRTGQSIGPPLDEWTLSIIFHQYIERLRGTGYFEESVPGSSQKDAAGSLRLDFVLNRRLGTNRIWTDFTESWDDAWSEPLLFSVVEVLYDLISRPRLTIFDGGAAQFRDFDRDTAQQLFRQWVNTQLAGSSLEYRMAESGEDVGRIVGIGSDELAPLIDWGAQRPRDEDGNDVRHAVALYRARDVTIEQKRSAIVTLAGVLERREAILDHSLLKKDDSALFNIANGFDLRHRDLKQRTDYDPAFLDWIFHWYLATTELISKLLDQQSE